MPKNQANANADREPQQITVEMPEPTDIADAPLTVGNLVKWCSIVFTVVTVVVGCVWFIASVKSDNLLMKQEIESLKTKVVEVDKSSEKRHDLQEKEIGELTRRTDNTEKAVQEMARKLDVAVALLERIDQKVGKP